MYKANRSWYGVYVDGKKKEKVMKKQRRGKEKELTKRDSYVARSGV
jgi:hypothetical protein